MIRLSRPGDGPTVKQLVDMAMHGAQGPDGIEGFHQLADKGFPDISETALVSKSRGITKMASALFSLRILDTEGEAVGIAHCAPPLEWVLKRSGLPLGSAAKLAGRLTELNLLAVMPTHRHQQHGEALLNDAIDRYTAAGYTTMMVLVDRQADDRLKPWYEKRGFRFAPLGSPFEVRFWSHRSLFASCAPRTKENYLGMMSLTDTVFVDTYPVTRGLPPMVTGILD